MSPFRWEFLEAFRSGLDRTLTSSVNTRRRSKAVNIAIVNINYSALPVVFSENTVVKCRSQVVLYLEVDPNSSASTLSYFQLPPLLTFQIRDLIVKTKSCNVSKDPFP